MGVVAAASAPRRICTLRAWAGDVPALGEDGPLVAAHVVQRDVAGGRDLLGGLTRADPGLDVPRAHPLGLELDLPETRTVTAHRRTQRVVDREGETVAAGGAEQQAFTVVVHPDERQVLHAGSLLACRAPRRSRSCASRVPPPRSDAKDIPGRGADGARPDAPRTRRPQGAAACVRLWHDPGVSDADRPAARDPALAPYDAVLLLSFGGPERPQDVLPFLQNVTAGRGIPRERLDEVAGHYLAKGGRSPINDQNRALIAALAAEADRRGLDVPILWGNRNWSPYLVDTLREAVDAGHRRVLAVVTSAFSSLLRLSPVPRGRRLGPARARRRGAHAGGRQGPPLLQPPRLRRGR